MRKIRLPLSEKHELLPWFIDHTKAEVMRTYSSGFCLDAGCGIGKYFSFFNATTLIGIDLYVTRLGAIQDDWKAGVHLIGGDLRSLPFRDGLFNFICFFEVIEHLSKRNGIKVINEFKRITKSNAKIVVTTPNCGVPFGLIYHDLLVRIGVVIERFIFKRNLPQIYGEGAFDVHLSFYSTKDLKKLGFQVHGVGDLGGFFIPLNTLLRKKPLMRHIINRFIYENPFLSSHLLGIWSNTP